MTLLRMIAFAPDEAHLSPGASPSTKGKPATAERPPSQDSAGAVGVESTLADGTRWHEVVESLEIGGVARMIAEHSVVGSHEGDRLRLTLDTAHDTLLNPSQQTALQRALARGMGSDLLLEIEVGRCTAETPAQRNARIAAERQQQAEQTLKRDGVVQSLLSEFDGTLGDVKPMEDSAG